MSNGLNEMLLPFQQKYKEALDVLEGDLGKNLDANTAFLNYVNTKKLEYLKKLGKWEQVSPPYFIFCIKEGSHFPFFHDRSYKI